MGGPSGCNICHPTHRQGRFNSSADLAGSAGVPFLPHGSMCDPPKAARSVEEDNLPREGRTALPSRVYKQLCSPARTSKQSPKMRRVLDFAGRGHSQALNTRKWSINVRSWLATQMPLTFAGLYPEGVRQPEA